MLIVCFLGLFVRHNSNGPKYFIYSLVSILLWPLFLIAVFIFYRRNSKEYYFQFIETSPDTFSVSLAKGGSIKKLSEVDHAMNELGVIKCAESVILGHYTYYGRSKREVVDLLKSKGWIEICSEQPKEEEE